MPAAKRIGKSLFPAVVALFVALLLTSGVAAQDYHYEELRIPFPGDTGRGLEAMLIRPAGAGRYPLALLSHGLPRNPAERKTMWPHQMYPQAIEFARSGYAVLIVMRRGYGDTDLPYAEGSDNCNPSNYVEAAKASSLDLAAAVTAMKTRDDVMTERMIAVGYSAGGFAAIAFAAGAPAGLAAVISFAGGRGSRATNDICEEARLIEAFAKFGRTALAPMLWIYSDNDRFFKPGLSRQFQEAFTKAGGHAELMIIPPFGNDGHFFWYGSVTQWTSIVDYFLKKHDLPRELRLAPRVADLRPPPSLDARGRSEFSRYLAAGPHRAFAISSKGSAWGWEPLQRSAESARAAALARCAPYAPDCKIYAVDDALEPAQ